jgi:hypothetical protein
VAFLDPGPAQNGACPFGKDLGPVPFAVRHRHQRSLAQRDREIIGRAGHLPDADRILQGLTARCVPRISSAAVTSGVALLTVRP